MIVTMDGPAGAGKSSLARMLAQRLGFAFLDTGAMYRCVTLSCLERRISLEDAEAIAQVAESISIVFDGERTLVDDQDVTDRLRTPEVTNAIRPIADNQIVRKQLVRLQQAWAGSRNVVTEGRDQGTIAFPMAECKIFLTASPEERAKRRVAQLEAQGVNANCDEILAQQTQRDDEDIGRVVGGLKAAPDSIHVHTDGMSEEEVLKRLEELVLAKMQPERLNSEASPFS